MIPARPEWWLAYCQRPYRFRGRGPDAFDCWGLVAFVLREEFGREVDDFGALYPSEGRAGVSEARQIITGELPAWRCCKWEEGAACLFRVRGQAVHIGIATAKPLVMLHAHGSTGVDLVDIRQAQKWKERYVGCYLPS